MTKIFFVRHAQPEHNHADDRTRPLTEEGLADCKIVLETLKDKEIDAFYCSPYLRSVSTIQEVADYYGMEIQTDERLREREKGPDGNNHGMFQKRWADHDYHEDGGESIHMVQTRNIEALKEILEKNTGKNIVIGTHGTALSTIMNYYKPEFGCEDFLRIIDWMPYIVELDFEGQELVGITEHAYIEKEFKGKARADKNPKKTKKIAFICVHNSCRSQIAEALGRKYLSDRFDCYSAGTETKPQINQDAVRIMKELYGIDMEQNQYSKLLLDIPNPDIAISMGCNVSCPFIGRDFDDNWGLDDPTGKSDEEFIKVIKAIEAKILELRG